MIANDRPLPWRIVAGATLALVVGNGPVLQFTVGIFMGPIAQDLALSRGTVSAALSSGLLGTALAARFVGAVMDRYGTARVVVPSIFAFALLLLLQGAAARGVTSLFALSILTGVAAAGQSPIGYARTIVAAFAARRGLALGIAMTGVGIGTIGVPVVAASLIAALGWRTAYAGLAVGVLVIALPGALISVGRPSKARTTAETRARCPFDWRNPGFLKLAAAFTLVALAANGTIAHVVPMLIDRGVAAARAAQMLAVIGVALIVGRLMAGWMLDLIDPTRVTAAFFGSVLAGVALLGLGPVAAVVPALLLIGLGLGAEIDLLAYLVGRLFGTVAFGEVYGALFALFMVGSSVGPLFLGVVYDRAGSYGWGLEVLGGALVAAIGLTLSLKRDLRPAQAQPNGPPTGRR